MPLQGNIEEIYQAICWEVSQVLGSNAFQEWRAREPKLSVSDLIVFNNSFLYREGVTGTTKSKKYLSVTLDSNGEPGVAQVTGRINSTFKRIPSGRVDQYNLQQIRAAIADETTRLGTIIFSLAGKIGEDEPTSVELHDASGFSTLRYEPKQLETADVLESTISVNRLDDIDVVWQAIVRQIGGTNTNLAENFEKCFSDLREKAGRPIDVEDVGEDAPSILSEVIAGIDEQVIAYETALRSHLERPDDVEALHEVMRIAYNFADGARELVALVVGISDLKPLVAWLTISTQSHLADKFGSLPFALVGKSKPSLEKYRSLIAGARNRAFHDLFAFGRPFRVPLKSDAFQAASLHLFREYRRGGQALEFMDRELVDLLQGFTRSAEQPVPLGFWEKNLEVMRAIGNMARALKRALVLVAPRMDP